MVSGTKSPLEFVGRKNSPRRNSPRSGFDKLAQNLMNNTAINSAVSDDTSKLALPSFFPIKTRNCRIVSDSFFSCFEAEFTPSSDSSH